jgi:CDP-diacylglycerol--serine O-phosphatidyltransferase
VEWSNLVRKIAIIPTLLTLGNAVCGFAAVVLASKITPDQPDTLRFFAFSGWLILGAMIFDSLDGYVARLSKTASDFGGQLDSLCDAISFGVAPAFLLLKMGQDWTMPMARQALTVIAVLYMACAILRLARFNVENSPDPAAHKRFKGLPSPAAAGCLAGLAILLGETSFTWVAIDAERVHSLVKLWAPAGALIVALLMVSRVPFPHLTNHILRGRKHLGHLVQILLIVCLLVITAEFAFAILFWGYALVMPVRYLVLRLTKHSSVAASQPNLHDTAHR